MRKYIVIFSAIGALFLFQNCSIGGGGSTSNVTTSTTGISVACHPTNDCLHYSVDTWGQSNCPMNYNKVSVDNKASLNGGQVTAVQFDRCTMSSSSDACCPTGLVTATFHTYNYDHSVSISIDNDPTKNYSASY